jgi:acetoin utilization deacetylase AcuC-like enzyme
MLNDQVIAAQFLLDNNKSSTNKILIIDLDVHQGNGTAEIKQHQCFTFSTHGKPLSVLKEQSD